MAAAFRWAQGQIHADFGRFACKAQTLVDSPCAKHCNGSVNDLGILHEPTRANSAYGFVLLGLAAHYANRGVCADMHELLETLMHASIYCIVYV